MSYTKNGETDLKKFKYSVYGVSFSLKTHQLNGENTYDLVTFDADLSDSKHAENQKNNTLILGKISLKLNDTTFKPEGETEANYASNSKTVMSFHFQADNSYLYVKGKKNILLKQKAAKL